MKTKTSSPWTVCSLQSTVYSLQSTVYSLQSTVYSLQSTVDSQQSTANRACLVFPWALERGLHRWPGAHNYPVHFPPENQRSRYACILNTGSILYHRVQSSETRKKKQANRRERGASFFRLFVSFDPSAAPTCVINTQPTHNRHLYSFSTCCWLYCSTRWLI